MKNVWEVFALQTLKDHRAKKAAVTSLQQQIAQLKSSSTSIRSVTADSQPLKGGGNKREDAMLNNITMRAELEKNLDKIREDVRRVEQAMAILSEEEQRILDKFYIHPEKGRVERLCCDLGYEKTTIYKKHDTALYHYTLAYYGRSGT